MPDPRTVQPEGDEIKFFANASCGKIGLPELDSSVLAEMNRDQPELTYGEYDVSPETFKFLKALESQLGREWIEQHLGIGKKGEISLDKNGNIFFLDLWSTEITSLPELLPSHLTTLNCASTNIITLPKLPGSLKKLDCSQSKIITISDLPVGLESCDFSGTPLSENPKRRAELEAECEAKGISIFI